MPTKTIYVREEDISVFEEAMKKFGGEESMSSVIIEALREKLRDRKKEEETVLDLVLALECSPPCILAECVEHRLRDFPNDVVVRSRIIARAAYESDPTFFTERGYWELGDEAWFKEARDIVIPKGMELLRKELKYNNRLPREETPIIEDQGDV